MFNCFYFVYVLYFNQYNLFYFFYYNNNILDICEILCRVLLYIVCQWKEVCCEFGVLEMELFEIEMISYSKKILILVYCGLCFWFEKMGKLVIKEKFIFVFKKNGL